MKRSIPLLLLAVLISAMAYGVCFEMIESVAKRFTPLAPSGTAAWYEMRSEMADEIRPYRIA